MSACRFVATDQPRAVVGEHYDHCADDRCRGCWPCLERHCVVCRRTHVDVTCAECLAGIRDDLRQIREMCGLPLIEELLTNGRDEARMLIGPTANPEAWGHRAMSAMMGRVDAAYLNDCRDEKHPLWVLGTWSEVWRDHLNQHSDLPITLQRAADYVDRHLHEMAKRDDPDFGQFAEEVRGCREHLQLVLRDQDKGDRANVGCFDCGGRLERKLTKNDGFEDVWTCGRCRRRYTPGEYNFALRATLEGAREESA